MRISPEVPRRPTNEKHKRPTPVKATQNTLTVVANVHSEEPPLTGVA